MPCPNRFPITNADYKLAIIGEAPGRDEELIGQPFVGMSGRFLKALMGRAGINPDACFFGNVSQDRPPNNEIEYFQWNGPEIQSGLELLSIDLARFQPHLCLLLGNTALKAFKDRESIHPLKPGRFSHSVSNWRGSLFNHNPFGKAMATYHPAAVIRQYEYAPILQFDLKKAAKQARFPQLQLPERQLIIPQNVEQLLFLLGDIKTRKPFISVDIEGGIGTMSCLSIAESPFISFIVPFSNLDGGSYWQNELDEVEVWRLVGSILEDPGIPKVLQNSLYDRFVLQYSYGIVVRGVCDDTMLAHWELYCELEKSLGVQASIYTDEPYYKFERKAGDRRVFFEYCCKDSAVTHEIIGKITTQLKPETKSYDHYRFNVDLLNPLLYMELRGIEYDWDKAKRRRADVLTQLYEHQHQLDRLSNRGISGLSLMELNARRRDLMCFKRDPTTPKKAYVTTHTRVTQLIQLAGKSSVLDPQTTVGLTNAEAGELSTLLELSLNVDSAKQFHPYLYEELRLPLQTNKEKKTTADETALIKLRKKATKGTLPHEVLNLAIQIRRLGTREGMLSIHPDRDGRIRCGYNIVGTETGRLTCYTSPTGSGYNLQTIPKEDRDLFVADRDHHLFQCDLSGADGWTVGAHCKALGDPTMLDDLYGGVKPAKVLCLGLRGNTRYLSPNTPREEIREACKGVKSDDWDYFACKIGIWGTAYLMGVDLLRNTLLEQSDGELDWSRQEAYDFQRLVFIRYALKRWHEQKSRELSRRPIIVAASGHKRTFFGRSTEILGKALAHEPQANTTYATNLAMWKLWTDPENRVGPVTSSPRLKIEPLHQVHDAIVGQFHKDDTAWAITKIKSYFANPLVIANQVITIPFEGFYGPSWGELPHPI